MEKVVKSHVLKVSRACCVGNFGGECYRCRGGCQAEEGALPWVVIESARLWIQVAGMRFLQQVARLTVRDRAKTLDMQNE